MTRLNITLSILNLIGILSMTVAQRTVGTLVYQLDKVYDGFNLIYPEQQGNIYLLDNCGRIINMWEDSVYTPGFIAHLDKNGKLIRCNSRNATSNPTFHSGGGGELLERRDWNNNLEWSWAYNNSQHRLHHDIDIMPNGNILAIAWERKSQNEAITNGRRPDSITTDGLWPDHIIEIKPIGSDSAEIVWEWHMWDHLVQDFDNTKQNYGNVGNSPGLIDINFMNSARADWAHLNSVNYNAELDQIIVCGPFFNELWVIDHSTTTAEAAGHTGGNSGKGGDLLYRWGNPRVYRQGDESDQKFFFIHDAHWMDYHLSNANPDKGNIMVFNNRAGNDYSEVVTLDPPYDSQTKSYEMQSGKYLPDDVNWVYQANPPNSFFSPTQAGCQRLPNGNTLITVANASRLFEVTEEGEMVWEYQSPVKGGGVIASQGDTVYFYENSIFKMYRYPKDFAGFDGKDLNPGGYIQLNPDTNFCKYVGVAKVSRQGSNHIKLTPNPASNFVEITGLKNNVEEIRIYNSMGNLVMRTRVNGTQINLNISGLESGIYFIQAGTQKAQKLIKL